jgi:hypothetical protein
MKQLRVKDCRFEHVGAMPCAILVCQDGSEVHVPAEAFLVIASKARQYLNSTAASLVAGEWIAARYQRIDQIRTGTTDDGRVALQLDPGKEHEICLSLEPKTARELGQALIDRPSPDASLGKPN